MSDSLFDHLIFRFNTVRGVEYRDGRCEIVTWREWEQLTGEKLETFDAKTLRRVADVMEGKANA